MPKLLLFAATTGYQLRTFADAARRLGVDLQLATDCCCSMDDPWGDHAISVKFDHRMRKSLGALRGLRVDGVAAVGDAPAIAAAEAAEMLGVPFHPPAAARACHDKYLARQLYRAAGLPVPAFFRVPVTCDAREAAGRAPFPCVLKPLGLSGSRGVIRANGEDEFLAAFARIRKLLEAAPDIRIRREEQNRYLQVESYIEGREFALEGVVTEGRLQTLALFDKPDPLDGPYFEESIYVTPSRQDAATRTALVAAAAEAVRALGLRHGPVHAEMRWNRDGAWILEIAARPIGGLCARALRFRLGAGEIPLEELLLRHALGEDVSTARPAGPASGVMMIPIPRPGVFISAGGVDRAAAVPGIEEVIVTAKEGQQLVPLPEGASYLGFIFARGADAAGVEAALRQSHAQLTFRLATALETLKP